MRKVSRRNFLKTLGVGALAGTGAACYAQDCADWLEVVHKKVSLPRWDANGMRVAVLADLHVNNARELKRGIEAVQTAIALKPDLILIAGDFINIGGDEPIANVRKVLAPLSAAKCPKLAVMGNHDYVCPHPSMIVHAVQDSPATLLRNQIVDIEGVSVVGIDDAIQGLQKYDFFPRHRVSKSCIVLLHEPDYVSEIPKHASLQVSGHSHGGQVCLPFGIPLHTPRGARNYIAGYYPDAQIPLYVSRGIGTSGVNYRLFCRPEVTLLTLRSA